MGIRFDLQTHKTAIQYKLCRLSLRILRAHLCESVRQYTHEGNQAKIPHPDMCVDVLSLRARNHYSAFCVVEWHCEKIKPNRIHVNNKME